MTARKIIKGACKVIGRKFPSNKSRAKKGGKKQFRNRFRQLRNGFREWASRMAESNECATEKLGKQLPAMEQEDVSKGINDERARERERANLPNSGLIFIPIIIAVIARTARREGAKFKRHWCEKNCLPMPFSRHHRRCFSWVLIKVKNLLH